MSKFRFLTMLIAVCLIISASAVFSQPLYTDYTQFLDPINDRVDCFDRSPKVNLTASVVEINSVFLRELIDDTHAFDVAVTGFGEPASQNFSVGALFGYADQSTVVYNAVVQNGIVGGHGEQNAAGQFVANTESAVTFSDDLKLFSFTPRGTPTSFAALTFATPGNICDEFGMNNTSNWGVTSSYFTIPVSTDNNPLDVPGLDDEDRVQVIRDPIKEHNYTLDKLFECIYPGMSVTLPDDVLGEFVSLTLAQNEAGGTFFIVNVSPILRQYLDTFNADLRMYVRATNASGATINEYLVQYLPTSFFYAYNGTVRAPDGTFTMPTVFEEDVEGENEDDGFGFYLDPSVTDIQLTGQAPGDGFCEDVM